MTTQDEMLELLGSAYIALMLLTPPDEPGDMPDMLTGEIESLFERIGIPLPEFEAGDVPLEEDWYDMTPFQIELFLQMLGITEPHTLTGDTNDDWRVVFRYAPTQERIADIKNLLKGHNVDTITGDILYIGKAYSPEVCPRCGAECKGDVTIADHGMCIDCFHNREDDTFVCDWCGIRLDIDDSSKRGHEYVCPECVKKVDFAYEDYDNMTVAEFADLFSKVTGYQGGFSVKKVEEAMNDYMLLTFDTSIDWEFRNSVAEMFDPHIVWQPASYFTMAIGLFA